MQENMLCCRNFPFQAYSYLYPFTHLCRIRLLYIARWVSREVEKSKVWYQLTARRDQQTREPIVILALWIVLENRIWPISFRIPSIREVTI